MISFLLSLYRKQLFMKVRYKRERSAAGLCFCRILSNDYAFAIQIAGSHRMIDRNGVLLKIDSAPLQPNDLAAPQAIKRPQQHRKFQFCSCNSFKEFIQFLFIIEAAVELILLGSLDFIRRVSRNHIILDRIFECLMDICVIVDHRRGLYPLQLFLIEHLNIMCLQIP